MYIRYGNEVIVGELFKFESKFLRTQMSYINKIWHNYKKKTVIVLFYNGDKVKIKKADDNKPYDIYTAVAIAHMIKRYKTNSGYKAFLKRNFKGCLTQSCVESSPIYESVAIYEVSKQYGSYEKFKNVVKKCLDREQ